MKFNTVVELGKRLSEVSCTSECKSEAESVVDMQNEASDWVSDLVNVTEYVFTGTVAAFLIGRRVKVSFTQ